MGKTKVESLKIEGSVVKLGPGQFEAMVWLKDHEGQVGPDALGTGASPAEATTSAAAALYFEGVEFVAGA